MKIFIECQKFLTVLQDVNRTFFSLGERKKEKKKTVLVLLNNLSFG